MLHLEKCLRSLRDVSVQFDMMDKEMFQGHGYNSSFPTDWLRRSGRLALHCCTFRRSLRFSAVILEALPEHDLVRGLELQAASAEATLE